MTRRFASLLRRIVGRIRQYMDDNRIVVSMGVAGFAIPSAIGVFVLSMQSDFGTGIDIGLIVVTASLFIIGMWMWLRAIRLADKQHREGGSLVKEIHDLVGEIRRDRDERHNRERANDDQV